jgi:hypothetical protein
MAIGPIHNRDVFYGEALMVCTIRWLIAAPARRMRSYFIGVALSAGFYAGTVAAAELAYEPFSYPPGDLNGGTATTASGFTGSWTRLIANAADRASIVSGSLSYPGLSTSANRFENVHNRLTEPLDTSAAGPFTAYLDGSGNIGADGTTLYLSVLLRQHPDPQVPNPSPAIGYEGFELWRGDPGSDGNRKVSIDLWTGHGDGAANYWATAWQPTNVVASSSSLTPGNTDTHLFVLKMIFGAGNNDVVQIFADPPLSAEPAIPTGTISTLDLSFNRLGTSIFSGRDNAFTADEIRIGSSYADVVPEPSSLLLCLAAAVALLRHQRRAD